MTIPANTSISTTFDATKYGYTPIGIIGISTTRSIMDIIEYYISSTNVACTVRNLDSHVLEGVFVRTRILYKSN